MCDPLLNLRLTTLDIGNYAVGLRARFALSCDFLLTGIFRLIQHQLCGRDVYRIKELVYFIQLLSASSGDADDV